ncbi:Asp-tRNA(Asn)/Glu-tRNA(Gln) amidotransferase subunit GatC [candidate division KSB1 bacterium]|nr:Asp-tRNA(Asn)/Glu-tRNA(Gln) amidotransferase subunit GatC [candidate division KSB1 bacterium]
MSITIQEVQHLAKLAKLSFSEVELAKIAKELDEIVGYVEQLKELNVEDIAPTSHVLDLANVFREDKVESALPVEEVLRNAPATNHGYFSVPKVIG